MAIAALKGASRGVSQVTGIAQDNIIFAMLLFAFVVWITTKGELTLYLSFFKPGAAAGPATDPVTASSTTGATNPAGAFGGATTAGGATGIIGQILNPSTDPVAGPISKVIQDLPKGFSLPGFGLGLGN